MSREPFLSLPIDVVGRSAHRRSEVGLLPALRGQGSTRVVVVHRERVATRDGRISLVTPEAAARLGAAEEDAIWAFLGEDARGALLGLILSEEIDLGRFGDERPSGDGQWLGLREVLEGPDSAVTGVALAAVALASWHAGHRFCPRCGAPTTVDAAGWVRRCSAQGNELYPRTDPAVIMAVTDPDDRLLLGRVGHWPQGMFSTLAGFVEPGETAEDAVRREVAEEVAVGVGQVAYRGSQPWPFPGSLMLAYSARAETIELRPDGVEVTDARWFTRQAFAAGLESGSLLIPSRASISRLLIEDWFGCPLPER